MGWGSILGDFAKGFAKGYIEERGVQGTIEDLGDLASSAKGLFSGSSDNSTASRNNWNALEDNLSNAIQEGDFSGALKSLDSYYDEYEGGNADEYYYYWRALVLVNWLETVRTTDDYKLIDEALQKVIREGRTFNNSEVNAEFKEIKVRQSEAHKTFCMMREYWAMQERFDAELEKGNGAGALDILNKYYRDCENGNKDFFYYRDMLAAERVIFINRNEQSAQEELDNVRSLLAVAKECLKGMQETEKELSENQVNDIDQCKELIKEAGCSISVRKCNVAMEAHDFDEAFSIAEKELKYVSELEYLNGLSRIESVRLEYLVGCNETSVQAIEDAIDRSEKALRSASEKDDDPETRSKRIEVVSARIEKGKNYLQTLTGNKTSAANSSAESGSAVSDSEKEYIEEVKACLSDDAMISERERRLLDKLRKSLGISEERAAYLENMCSHGMSEAEKEYFEELKECMSDGNISDKERRLLNRLRISLNISEERAAELEKQLDR